jgi:heme-degrading monooxygenase HmoA
MVLEIADFLVRDGAEDAFTTAYRDAVRFVTGSPGCRAARLVRGVENPRRFVLLVEWERLEDHLAGFRGSPAFRSWRAAVGPHLAADPRVEHAVDV